MNQLRRYRLHVISVALSAVAMVAATPLVAQASVPGPTASSVLKATLAAISMESGVHVTHTSTTGSTRTSIVGDIGKTAGTERISSGSNTVTITVTSSFVYLSGNPGGLVSIMGLTSAQQKKVGSDSLAMKAGTTPYKDLALSGTIALVSRVLPAAKGTTCSTQVIHHKRYYRLRWTTKATSSTPKELNVITISAGKAPLPVTETITASSGAATTTFSKWGEPISAVTPPSSSLVTYAQVFG